MAENVGELLKQHASGLSTAVKSLITDAFVADSHSKDLALDRRMKAFKLPPFEFSQHLVYDERQEDGSLKKQVVAYEFLVPGVMVEDGTTLEIVKYEIKSTFESIIKKTTGVQSETDTHAGGEFGGLAFPKIEFDITEKLTVNHNSEQSQHNTFDVNIELGQSDPSFGYIELVKAVTRSINQIMDILMKKGIENPEPISDEEAEKLKSPDGEKDGGSGE